MAQPVVRQNMTSLWSPKIESAWVAMVRAETWNAVGVSSPAILFMFGNHQQQTLRSGEGGGQGSGLQGAMNRAGGAAFALHFDDMRARCPRYWACFRGPLVGPFAHRRRRSDGIDGDDFVDAIGDVRDRLVGVHGLEFALHFDPPIPSGHWSGRAIYSGCRKGGVDVGAWVHRGV